MTLIKSAVLDLPRHETESINPLPQTYPEFVSEKEMKIWSNFIKGSLTLNFKVFIILPDKGINEQY